MAYVRASFVIGTASAIGTSLNVTINDSTGISWSTIPDGSTVDYSIQNSPANTKCEGGLGTKTTIAGKPVLQRSAANVESGSNGSGVLVNFTEATQQIRISPLAEHDVQPNVSSDPTILSLGQVWYRTDTNTFRGFNGTSVSFVTGTAVSSFNSRTGAVTLTSLDVTNALGDANIAFTDVANTFTAIAGLQTFLGSVLIRPPDAGTVPLTIQARTSQFSNWTEWKTNAGIRTLVINPTGNIGAGDNGTIEFDTDSYVIKNSAATNTQLKTTMGAQWADNLNSGDLLPGSSNEGTGGVIINNVRLGFICKAAGGAMSFANTDGALLPAPIVFVEYTNRTPNANTNVVTPTLVYYALTTGTPAAGFGESIQFKLDTTVNITSGGKLAAENIVFWRNTTAVTDSTRQGKWSIGCHDAGTSSTSPRNGLNTWSDGSAGRVSCASPSSAPADADLSNSEISFYLDEVGNNLKIRVKYSNGTLKTGTLALV